MILVVTTKRLLSIMLRGNVVKVNSKCGEYFLVDSSNDDKTDSRNSKRNSNTNASECNNRGRRRAYKPH